MRYGNKIVGLVATLAIASMPIASASARGFNHEGYGGYHGGYHGSYYHGGHHDGLLFGLIGAGAALTVAAATLVTAPVRAIAEVGAPPVYAEPAYPGPTPVVYAAPAYPYGYYRHPHRVVYTYPQPVYYGY